MSDEEINIAVAEACGWKECRIAELIGVHGVPPKSYKGDFTVHGGRAWLPSYTSDLNAMHEAEGYLRGLDWAKFFNRIQATGAASGVRATARQRAEAFLRALNLWKEGE